MTRHPLFGLGLATFGTLILTPDALLMRLSQMDGFQMAGWRGLIMGIVLILAWAVTSRHHRADVEALTERFGITIVICQVFNSTLFCLGIAIAPVAIVLFGVAAVPVFAALLAWLILGEPTRAITWAAIIAVLIGIGIAVSGKAETGVAFDATSLYGALFGLGVALVLALNFVVVRARPRLPILLAIGLGALVAGIVSTSITGIGQMGQGHIWPMALTAMVVLPVSFASLSIASRYTHAANVSLLMLLETVLGPLWVWLVLAETPTPRMMLGGTIVVLSLFIYLIVTGRRAVKPKPGS
ncbi:DMT family transporter [Roseovarius sp. 2305UL8-3]|uniref:DMT family transporter n=1 Tax=Roseovarius conchicola TaxID=3121636 RepID=UPI0035292A0A